MVHPSFMTPDNDWAGGFRLQLRRVPVESGQRLPTTQIAGLTARMRAELRPLSFGELLDRTFTYYREHFWLFVGIMAVPQVVMLVVGLGLSRLVPSEAAPGLPWLPFVVAAVGVVVLAAFGYAAAYGATTYAVSQIHLGRAVAIRGAYRMMRGQIMPLVYLGLVYLLRALLFFISIVLIPVIFLMPLWYAFAIPVLLLEKIGGNGALKRSGL